VRSGRNTVGGSPNNITMQIILTQEESEKYFHTALCNAVGTGYMNSYGIELCYNDEDYEAAKTKLESPCFEDVLMQILRDGKTLTLSDIEGNGTNNASITLKEVHERVSLTPIQHLSDLIAENDDAVTADVIIQSVFYKDIIFG
jgi:hypothetical protein